MLRCKKIAKPEKALRKLERKIQAPSSIDRLLLKGEISIHQRLKPGLS